MKKRNPIFRNEFDYLITDTLPMEMPAPFSFAPFYHWLNDSSTNNAKRMRDAIKGARTDNGFPGASYSSFPHRFLVMKKDGSNRALSCPTILGATMMMTFISHHQKEFLYDFSKPSFSIRKHVPNSSLVYVSCDGKGKRKAIHYISDLKSVENEVMEKTGMFYDLRPMHNLSRLWKSNVWKRAWARFPEQPCLHVDIENCFPSIYSHTLGWIFPHEGAESKGFSGSKDYHNVLDRTLQRINSNETHGLIVGPEFSRLAAETLLTEIDSRVILKLERNYRYEIDYQVLRFVDDYYIFAKSKEIREAVLQAIENECASFFLRINSSKIEIIDNNEDPEWISDVGLSLKYLEGLLKEANASTSAKSLIRQMTFAYQALIGLTRSGENNANSLVAYISVSFARKLKSKTLCKRFLALPCVSFSFYKKLFSFLFQICGCAPRFYNIQNLAMMLNNVFSFSPKEKSVMVSNALESALFESGSICWMKELCTDKGIYDFMPLLLEFAALGIRIPRVLMQSVDTYFSSTKDPVTMACGIILYDKMGKAGLKMRLLSAVETRITSFLSDLYLKKHLKNAFLFPEIWYLFIFNKNRDISPCVQTSIDNMLNGVKITMAGKTIVELLIDYLLSSDYKVFDWDFFSKKSQRKWHYVTNKRTNLIKGDFYQL